MHINSNTRTFLIQKKTGTRHVRYWERLGETASWSGGGGGEGGRGSELSMSASGDAATPQPPLSSPTLAHHHHHHHRRHGKDWEGVGGGAWSHGGDNTLTMRSCGPPDPSRGTPGHKPYTNHHAHGTPERTRRVSQSYQCTSGSLCTQLPFRSGTCGGGQVADMVPGGRGIV